MPLRVTIPLIAAAVAVLGALVWLWTHRTEPRPASYSGERTSAMYAVIDSRARDAKPLTPAEVFPGATAGPLRKGATEELSDCDDALWGASATGCTQALRATFTSGSVTGQFVIFNLPDGPAADALVAALGHSGFVRQAASFDASHSRAQARALGHFVTVAWVGPTGSSRPDLLPSLIALDGLGHLVQARVITAT